MRDYDFTNNTSCVYDAFKSAGIPVTEAMLKGIKAKDVISILNEHGYKLCTDGEIEVPDNQPLFIMLQKNTSSSGHLEYHNNTDGLSDVLQNAEVLMIAVKG